jgi:2-haloacid dehalogenase
LERPAGIAFDAFGTLFDLEALAPLLGGLFEGFTRRLVPWTWLLTAVGTYRPLPEVAELAVRAAAAEARAELDDERTEAAVAELQRLPLKDDVAQGLAALEGHRLAVLSNGTSAGMEALLENAGVRSCFEHVLTADQVQRYKPSHELYSLAPRAFGAEHAQVLLVSGNDWDVASAKLAGLRTAWLARGRTLAPVLGVEPDIVVETLPELADRLSEVDEGDPT